MNHAKIWNTRYETSDFVWTTEPNRFLPPEVADLPPGRALDLACGEGRHAVWLARKGWQVTGVDFSEVGLSKGHRWATFAEATVDWITADVTSWSQRGAFDLVIAFYLQVPAPDRRQAFINAAVDLAPGGTLLIVGHDSQNLTEGVGGPKDPAVLYTPDDVVTDLRSAGIDLIIDRADRVKRPVTTDDGEAVAIDCLVRAHRPPSSH